jgi:DNA-binding LacI/PurR family transcriptional regulator
MPAVLIGSPPLPIRRPPGSTTSFISCDDAAIGAMAAKHFLSLGAFNGFGFLYSGDNQKWQNMRELGFRNTLAAAGRTLIFYYTRHKFTSDIPGNCI